MPHRPRRLRALFVSLLALLLAVPLQALTVSSAAAATVTTERIAGADRFETAVEVAKRVVPELGAIVILATGTNYPDALAAGPVSAALQAPILLAGQGRLPEATRAELQRQLPGRVLIVGGEAVIPASVEQELQELVPGLEIERYGGRDRHETAALLAKRFFPHAREAFVATGRNFPDALSAASVASLRQAPVLLGGSGGLTESTWQAMAHLEVERYWLVGGEGVLFRDLPSGPLADAPYERLAGEDRFGTAVAVADRFLTEPTGRVLVATASDFPDALVAAPLVVAMDAPLLLSRRDCAPESMVGTAERLLGAAGEGRARVTVIGAALEEDAVLTVCRD